MTKPKVRQSDILAQELLDETLIYDLAIDKAYCLNSGLAAVYNACDGTQSIQQIRQNVSARMKSSVTDEYIMLSLKELDENGLMENSEELKGDFANLSRRELVKRAGLATMVALPVITSLVAPQAAAAASTCIAYMEPCTPGGTPCCDPEFWTCFEVGGGTFYCT